MDKHSTKQSTKQARETLGQYLQRERETRNIALEDIPKAIHISQPFIMALERDDFDFFSQQEAIPGYLKLYTRHLGVDYDDALERYHIQSELNNHSKAFQQLPLLLDDYAFPIKPVQVNNKPYYRRIIGFAVPLVAAVLFIWFALYLYLLTGPTKDIEVNAPAPLGNAAQQIPEAVVTAVASPLPQAKSDLAPIQLEPEKSQPKPQTEALPAVEPVARINIDNVRAAAPPPATSREKATVIGNSYSKHYHLFGMQYYDQVKAYHRVEFDSEEEAVKAGYHKAPK